ncbi:MAG: ATP-dependent helicase, partial [Candidatus Saccharimonadales bacterium]
AQEAAAKVFLLYEKVLKDACALDFDDLINKTVELLQHYPEVRKKWQDQFKYILVDEYQDTNAAQYQLVKLLAGERQNLAVVGDDWQSVYSWRGADFRNILNFERDYPGCTVIKLEQNYRSTNPILEAANNVIAKNTQRSDKRLWTDKKGGQAVEHMMVANERDEAEAIIRRVKSAVNSGQRHYRDFAVLYRTNAQSRSIEEAFARYALPYRIIGGTRFYDRAEIKDVVAYLRLIYQPEDITSFDRIINVPSRGLGNVSLSKFNDWRMANGLSLEKGLKNAENCDIIATKALKTLAEFGEMLVALRRVAVETSVHGLIDSLLRRIDYLKYLDDGTP